MEEIKKHMEINALLIVIMLKLFKLVFVLKIFLKNKLNKLLQVNKIVILVRIFLHQCVEIMVELIKIVV